MVNIKILLFYILDISFISIGKVSNTDTCQTQIHDLI